MTSPRLHPAAPLVPADCDLRDFPYMPMDITRLFGSAFNAMSSDAGWRAGVTLFLKSYHQVPAASLPDDDVVLARLAEFGRDLRGWKRVRDEALYGWVFCDDGRLYHPVVAEKALEAWIAKMLQRKASAAGNATRWKQEYDPCPVDEAIGYATELLAALNPQSRMLSKLLARKPPRSSGRDAGGTRVGDPGSRPDDPGGIPKHRSLESQGKGSEVLRPSQEEGTSKTTTVGVVPLRAGGLRRDRCTRTRPPPSPSFAVPLARESDDR